MQARTGAPSRCTVQAPQSGMRAARPAHGRGELAAEPARDRPAMPLVEVTDEHAWPGQARRLADEAAEPRELGAALAETEAEVTVEDVERRAHHVEVHAQAAARLAPVEREVA